MSICFFPLLFCFLFSAISQGFWLWIPAHFSHWKFFRNPGGMSICYDIYKCLSCLICLVTKNKYGPALKKKKTEKCRLKLGNCMALFHSPFQLKFRRSCSMSFLCKDVNLKNDLICQYWKQTSDNPYSLAHCTTKPLCLNWFILNVRLYSPLLLFAQYYFKMLLFSSG